MIKRPVTLFISHASEDKIVFVDPLVEALRELFEVWYDTDSIIPGQGSLLKQISAGLHKSDYGVVIFSEAFFRKKWPQYELDGIFDLEIAEQKIMIPIWYKIGVEEVRNFSAIVAAQPAIRTNGEIEPVVAGIIRSVDAGEKTRRLLSPLAQKLQLVGQTATLNQKFEQLSRTEKGVALVRSGMNQIVNDLVSKLSEPVGALQFRVEQPKDGRNDWIMIYGPRRDDEMPLVLRLQLTGMAMNSVSTAALTAMIYFERTENLGLEFKGCDVVTKSTYTPYFSEDDHAIWRNPEL